MMVRRDVMGQRRAQTRVVVMVVWMRPDTADRRVLVRRRSRHRRLTDRVPFRQIRRMIVRRIRVRIVRILIRVCIRIVRIRVVVVVGIIARIGGRIDGRRRARRRRRLAVDFHVFPERTRMCVRLVTAAYFAVVRLVGSVDVRVLLAIGRIGEASVAAFEFAFEWFFA